MSSISSDDQNDLKVKAQQGLRLKRHAMAMATYGVIILALYVTSSFGFEQLSPLHWWIGLGLTFSGNAIFFFLIISNRNLGFKDPSLTWIQILFAGVMLMYIHYEMPYMRPIILIFFIPAFSFGMLRLTRGAYFSLVACVMGLYLLLLAVEYFQGRPGFQPRYELFLFIVFGIVLTWFAFFGGFISDIRRRLKIQAETIQMANEKIQREMEQRRKAQFEKDNLIAQLKEALSKVKTLGGLLPICASCKKIRDDKGYWNQLELYIGHHTDASFTHGICPDCAKKMLKEATEYDPNGGHE
ncbi:MAG: hypothetical protein M0036_09110 [Desulfobacteraceae bacterium]|nr:hypothetical protein [Desulfobacteraceae bacterium]